MKNKEVSLILGLIFIMAVLGCSRIIPGGGSSKSTSNGGTTSDNKTLTDKGLDVALGDEKTGVPECDDVVEFFNNEIDKENPDEDFVTKAVKKTFINAFKSQFRKAVEDSKSDKVQLAKTCKDFRANLEKYKAEEDSKKSSK
ncbi:MAG: hypothetical protein ABI878_13060 [Acidobacteriota bacterium]